MPVAAECKLSAGFLDASGVSLMTSPMAGALTLTYVLGLVLLISGLLRVYMGFCSLRAAGGLLLLSGLFGVLAGLLIIFQWPSSGLWVARPMRRTPWLRLVRRAPNHNLSPRWDRNG